MTKSFDKKSSPKPDTHREKSKKTEESSYSILSDTGKNLHKEWQSVKKPKFFSS